MEISAIRYCHIAHGMGDFESGSSGIRRNVLLRSLSKRIPTRKKLPYNLEQLQWVYDPHLHDRCDERKTKETAESMNLGFLCVERNWNQSDETARNRNRNRRRLAKTDNINPEPTRQGGAVSAHWCELVMRYARRAPWSSIFRALIGIRNGMIFRSGPISICESGW